MEVFECIAKRRSIRSFLDKPVPKAVVKKLLRAGVLAPTARHREPWRFVVVQDKKKIAELEEKVKEQYGVLGLSLKTVSKILGRPTVFHNAPLIVFIAAKKGGKYFREDCAACAQNMLLAARALGIGSCWIGMANVLNKDGEALSELGIPREHEILAALIFGFPRGGWPKTPKREPKILKWID